MAKIVIGIGEVAVSSSLDDEIKTFALGSCVALILLDPKSRVCGMAHIALPLSEVDLDKSKKLPCYFADTGIPHLIDLMKKEGATIGPSLIIKLAGGANVIGTEDHFKIGIRNVTEIKKILWKLNLPVRAEDVGGNMSRTVSIDLSVGKVNLSSSDSRTWRI